MADKAGTWQRVSSGGQDEANQLPDLNNWCDTHDYEITKRYVLHGKSASKGRHDKALDQVIRDMEDGKINVLVVWQSSRLERRGVFSVFDFQRRVLNAGGRIEYVQDTHLNEANEMSDVALAMNAHMDKGKSLTLSKQMKAKHEALRAKGSAIGRPAWGYRIQCEGHPEHHETKRCGHLKRFVPTAEGRQWIPQIFQWAIDGKPLLSIAKSLDAAGVRTVSGKPWNQQFLSIRLIKNPVYYGERRNNGTLETEALISATVWQEANAVVSSRVKPGRGTTKREKVLFKPYCGACWNQPREGCPSGKSPMYRSDMPYGDKPGFYYRCYGQGPQRKGCGFMVSVDELDAVVLEAKAANLMWHRERVFVAGDLISDEIAKLAERVSEAALAGKLDEAQKCLEQMAELKAKPRVAPHWEERDSDMTEADYFASLTRDQRREYLAKSEIVASRGEDGLMVSIVPQAWVS